MITHQVAQYQVQVQLTPGLDQGQHQVQRPSVLTLIQLIGPVLEPTPVKCLSTVSRPMSATPIHFKVILYIYHLLIVIVIIHHHHQTVYS